MNIDIDVMDNVNCDYIELKNNFINFKKFMSNKFIIKILNENDAIVKKVVQGDYVKYEKINDIIVDNVKKGENVRILEIIRRKPFFTIAIVKNVFRVGTNGYCTTFFFPLLPKTFEYKSHKLEKIYKKNERYIFYLDSNFLVRKMINYNNVPTKYLKIDNREGDCDILSNLYNISNRISAGSLINSKSSKKYDALYTKQGRIDLTNIFTFSIDGETTKDFDDAISIDIEKGKVFVHIVDINYYFEQDMFKGIEQIACNLAFSLYLKEKISNMLPNIFSEQIMSLKKNKVKMAITVEFSLRLGEDENPVFNNSFPVIDNYEIYQSKIKVNENYVYDTVDLDLLLETNKNFIFLKNMAEVYSRHKQRGNEKVTTFDINPIDSTIEKLKCKIPDISNVLIELFMVLTNLYVINHLKFNDVSNIPYRVHPDSGINLNNFNHLPPELLEPILKRFIGARYDLNLSQHYGLQLDTYSHFTSPIRRFSDVIIHRRLAGYEYDKIERIIQNINEREMINTKIDRLYTKWKIMDYFNRNKNIQYNAIIIDITKSGVFFKIKKFAYSDFVLYFNVLDKIKWVFHEDVNDKLNNFIDGNNYHTREYFKIKIGDKVNVKCDEINFFSYEGITWKIVN